MKIFSCRYVYIPNITLLLELPLKIFRVHNFYLTCRAISTIQPYFLYNELRFRPYESVSFSIERLLDQLIATLAISNRWSYTYTYLFVFFAVPLLIVVGNFVVFIWFFLIDFASFKYLLFYVYLLYVFFFLISTS